MADAINRLIAIMARLRHPTQGCPWDLEQDFSSIAPHTIEEAYEVAEAIRSGDMAAIKDELGDLLFQTVFYAQMGSEQGAFDFDAIAAHVAEKMLRRHPHIFGAGTSGGDGPRDAVEQAERWEAIKAGERSDKAGGEAVSALDGVAFGLPALTRALKLQKRAARVGFDWTRPHEILNKIEEEIGELRAEIEAEQTAKARIQDELGDLAFALVNLARRLEIDPEAALRGANAKFERRFKAMEEHCAAQGQRLQDHPLEVMEDLWSKVKADERRSS
jgi:nucleoside triphosphate diphosphatase